MKLGLISDVHGDYKALLHALSLLRDRHHVDAIWCAGDLVGRGKQPDAVVERISTAHIPTVMGNHDEMVLLPHHVSKDKTVPLGDALGYQANTLERLMQLPRTYRTVIGGARVVMVHGTPLSNLQGISINPKNRHDALHWLERASADILIAGHTHTPMKLQDHNGMIVNPGSLFDPNGSRRSSSETYGVLNIINREFEYFPLWG